jgi:hypothetical protein
LGYLQAGSLFVRRLTLTSDGELSNLKASKLGGFNFGGGQPYQDAGNRLIELLIIKRALLASREGP